jgi:hypothetical protein
MESIISFRIAPQENYCKTPIVWDKFMTKQLVTQLSKHKIRREYPLDNLVLGWFFRSHETSWGSYLIEGVDLWGRKISRRSSEADIEKTLSESARDAQEIQVQFSKDKMDNWREVLSKEFSGGEDSLLFAIYFGHWNSTAYERLVLAMQECCRALHGQEKIERWIVAGFYDLSQLVHREDRKTSLVPTYAIVEFSRIANALFLDDLESGELDCPHMPPFAKPEGVASLSEPGEAETL